MDRHQTETHACLLAIAKSAASVFVIHTLFDLSDLTEHILK